MIGRSDSDSTSDERNGARHVPHGAEAGQDKGRPIRAARELIAKRGLEDLRVSDETERADLAFGTFSNQFKTKDDIIEAAASAAS